VGPEHRFQITVPPEIVPVCLNELASIGMAGTQAGQAGLELSGRLKEAYICNLWLRTAGRVLCSLPRFRAGAAEELFYKVSRIPWDLWLSPEIPLDIEARVEYSRINHEGRVAEIVSGSIEKSLKKERFPNPPAGFEREEPARLKQKVYVGLVENHCLISLDMTGAHLHQRGYRPAHTGAPLRETLAAAILLKSAWNGREPLVDGMCGSGTFPIEAALISRRIAPGLGRDFLFQKWPSFQKETMEYLVRRAREDSIPNAPESIIGIDLDPEAVDVAAQNAGRAGVGRDIKWERMNFFDFNPGKAGLKQGLIVLNPPYGVRLDSGGVGLYDKIGAHLRLNFKGWKYAVLARSRMEAAALGTGRARLWNIRHGGMNVTVVLGRISS